MGLASADLRKLRMAFTHYFSGTGEHGVGIGKREYLYEELGEGTVELMRTIKRAVDPLNLFNPGKVGHFNKFAWLWGLNSYFQLYPDFKTDDLNAVRS